MGLNSKQRAFVEHYLQSWNATRAATQAGYSEKTAGAQGFELLKKPEIQGAISERLESKAMKADEVLARLSEQARFDVTPYLIFEGVVQDDGSTISVFAGIDVDKLKDDGLGHLLKGITKTNAGLKVEFHDAQKALELIGKHLGMFRERVEHSGPGGGPIVIDSTSLQVADQELAEWRKQQQERIASSGPNALLTPPIS